MKKHILIKQINSPTAQKSPVTHIEQPQCKLRKPPITVDTAEKRTTEKKELLFFTIIFGVFITSEQLNLRVQV